MKLSIYEKMEIRREECKKDKDWIYLNNLSKNGSKNFFMFNTKNKLDEFTKQFNEIKDSKYVDKEDFVSDILIDSSIHNKQLIVKYILDNFKYSIGTISCSYLISINKSLDKITKLILNTGFCPKDFIFDEDINCSYDIVYEMEAKQLKQLIDTGIPKKEIKKFKLMTMAVDGDEKIFDLIVELYAPDEVMDILYDRLRDGMDIDPTQRLTLKVITYAHGHGLIKN